MNLTDQLALIERLRKEPVETDWLEFKDSNYDSQSIGEYLSALSNSACVAGKETGYLVFGIEDKTHRVVGTSFDPYTTKGKGNQDLLFWLTSLLRPNVGFEVQIMDHPQGRVVLFEVKAAQGTPVRFNGTAYIRIGSSKTQLSNHPDKERQIWNNRKDWSAQKCEEATLADLDPAAIRKAREQFTIKNPHQAAEIASWENETFLNKAKLTIRGVVTNAVILLLGTPESAALLSPAVAKISWFLKAEKEDYQHFGTPFILQVDKILAKIRNLTLRTMPNGTLFPQEIDQYDPWVLREALHNCIAHQDYGLGGRINIVEAPNTIMFTNVGSFLPGSVERVIQQDAPLEVYRNHFLADAMVNLNMIDTQGGGIKKMFAAQVRRFFPLPDYDLSDASRVAVTIRGEVLDERYSALLIERTDLDLATIMLLDKVQKRVPVSREEHRWLKEQELVEGRYPNIFVAGQIAKITGEEVRHIRERGLGNKKYEDYLIDLVKEHAPVTRQKINDLLMGIMPVALSKKQKEDKIHNMLIKLSRKGIIVNRGSRNKSQWYFVRDITKEKPKTTKMPLF